MTSDGRSGPGPVSSGGAGVNSGVVVSDDARGGGVSPGATRGGSDSRDPPGDTPDADPGAGTGPESAAAVMRDGDSADREAGTATAADIRPADSPRTNADTLGHRSSGFFASARLSACRSPGGDGSRCGGRFRCCMSNWLMLHPSNGRTPVN